MSARRVRVAVLAAVCLSLSLGLAAAQEAPASPALRGREPADWLDPQTASASALGRGCGVVSEVTLSTTAQSAYIQLLLSSESSEVLAFDPSATLVQAGQGPKQRVRSPVNEQLALQPQWQQWLQLEMPSKGWLAGQRSLAIEVSLTGGFGGCRFQTRIERPPGPDRAETVTRYTNLELTFGGGARALATGALKRVAPGVGFSASFDLAIYWSIHHGATLDMDLQTSGSAMAREVDPERVFEGEPRIEATGFFLGYVGRLPLASWLWLSYSPQLGVIPFQLVDEGDDKQRVKRTSTVVTPRHRLRLLAPFASMSDGQFFTGLSLSHGYVPYGRLGEVPVSGHLVSGTLLFGMGG